MALALLSDPIFHDANKAREWLESRLWKDGPICPHCKTVNQATLMQGKTTRPGLYQCNACRKPFTVTVGTLYERSKIPLNKWLAATQLFMSSKKGMSSLQISHLIGVTQKTAWFMCHRIRESVKFGSSLPPMGGGGKTVEADETYFGPVEKPRPRNKYLPPPVKGGKVGPGQKRAIVSLVERGGNVRSFHIPVADGETVTKIVNENIHHESKLYTDQSRLYKKPGKNFAEHSTVNHSRGEYVRGVIHTNTIEGYFSIFKRGMKGIYQHCQEKHLHRYLAEFDFRYNYRVGLGFNDAARMSRSIPGIVGKRLTYRRVGQAQL